ncbi:MAG: DMT family transporter [Roseovarius sp.]
MTLQKDNTPLAVLIIVMTVFVLTLGDAAIKGMSTDLRLWQIFIIRSGVALPVLILLIRMRFSHLSLWPMHPGWAALRSAMLAMMWVLYYAALPHLELSLAAAAYYTLPLFITMFSAIFVGDRVGWTGWIAVAIGFVGVLVILRPASDTFTPMALLPLGSAILYALAMILTRTKCRAEHPLVLSAMLNVGFIVTGVAASLVLLAIGRTTSDFLSPLWSPLNLTAIGALGLMTVAILLGSIGTSIAYQIGRSSTVATFDFTYVGFATIWGVVFFAERPDGLALTGIALIVLAGLLAMKRRV